MCSHTSFFSTTPLVLQIQYITKPIHVDAATALQSSICRCSQVLQNQYMSLQPRHYNPVYVVAAKYYKISICRCSHGMEALMRSNFVESWFRLRLFGPRRSAVGWQQVGIPWHAPEDSCSAYRTRERWDAGEHAW